MTSISNIHGIDISELGVVKLDKQAFDSVDYELFTPPREHFLIHAIQFQQKLPSERSMLRSQIRNQRKSGQGQANQRVGRPTKVIINPKRQRRFIVPAKQLPKLDAKLRKRQRGRGRRGLATPLIANRKARATHRTKSTAFKISSPERVALKCARNACKQELKNWRAQIPPTIADEADATPLYFKKKKANQKRRRLEKHNLIKKNRKALYEIYGQAIFQTGWPISIKQIKAALGIKEQDHLIESVQGLADLVQQ